MAQSWAVKWNTKLYDTERRYEEGLQGTITIHQSKGRARMKIIPRIGDSVAVVWSGHIHMKGVVVREFTAGTNHQEDNANMGDIREHAEPEYFAIIELNSLSTPVRIQHTGQRTWVRMRDNL